MPFNVISGIGSNQDLVEELSRIDARLVKAPVWIEDDIISNARDADAVMAANIEPYTRRVIQALKKCKVISRMGAGYDNIDVAAATEEGIPVAYIPDASIAEVSDHALALLLALSRKIITVDRLVKRGAWQMGNREIYDARIPMYRLSEQTVGVVGAGKIGSAFIGKAKALGLKVIVYDPYLSAESAKKLGAAPVDFERLLHESDYVSLHAPLTNETRHLFNIKAFKKMKPTAYIINTSRGELINEKDLIITLTEHVIAGAGLDVTEPEPPSPDNPLIKLDNVIITAHSGFYSEHALKELRLRTAGAVVMALRGEWPPIIANPEVKERSNRRIR
ncbi:MAG: C-terminal binding protein [Chloroflexota bacterium]